MLPREGRSRLLVCGSRDWADRDAIARVLSDWAPDNPVIIHGAARGADRIAADIAESLGLETWAFPANWDLHGKRAGILRNLKMLDEGKPDKVIAFRTNGSRGTTHTIEAARSRGIPVTVIEP